MWFLKLIGHIIVIILLTAITQVGGLIWIMSILISLKTKSRKRIIFPMFYLFFNLVLVPPIASQFGREKLPWFDDNLKPRNWFFPLAFRNYVNPELKEILKNSTNSSKIKITYLDANFPFINGFPLLPHLSHNDGKKIDISFMYLDKKGISTNKKPSTSGYGIYANTTNKTSKKCLDNGNWQYDFTKHLTFGTINDLNFSPNKTRALILELLSYSNTQKVFIEPYLKQSLGLQNESKIRFHGCKAVRHDDHIHLQIK